MKAKEVEKNKRHIVGTSLVIQWLGFLASTAGGVGLIPGQRTEVLHAACCMTEKKTYCQVK